MSRADLLALTPQALASLSNRGLVNRAQKDLDEGKGPRLEELADGTVVGTFADGVTARLVPGRSFQDTPCTCVSTGVCRHRIATALAYPAFHAAKAPPAREAPPETAAEAAPEAPWSPGAVDDAELARRLPRRVLERAERLRKRGYLAQVRRGSFVGEDVPTVSLATCTVRFLVPRELSLVRCDCAEPTNCEHLALAVWAFRAADAVDPARHELSVEVARDALSATPGSAALDTAGDLVRLLLLEGVQHAGAGLAGRFAVARAGLEAARMAWPLGVLEELEELLGAYVGRSTRYDAPRFMAGVVELFARVRAARAPSHVPPRAVLGVDEAPETELKRVDLMSLGARLFADDRERRVEVVLADPAAAGLLVVRRAFTYTEHQVPEDGAALGLRRATPGTTLEAFARGQVVTSGATRRTNRQVLFSSRGLQHTSVTPQSGDWSVLPEPVRVSDVRALETLWRARPPRFLRPRLLAENVHAFEVSRVQQVAYAPGAQELRAELLDRAGHPFRVELAHRAVAPGALDALAEGLSGAAGRPRYVSGEARLTARGFIVEPLALSLEGTGVRVLDVQPATAARPLPRGTEAPPLTPLAALLTELEGCLAEGVHQGLRHVPPPWVDRLERLTERARGLGLKRLGEDLDALRARLATARSMGGAGEEAVLGEAWVSAAVRASVAQEQHGG